MNNLNELNSKLFDTLRGVIDGKIEHEKAATIVSISNAIVSASKVQVSAAKLLKNKPLNSDFFGVLEAPKTLNISGNLFDQKLDYAKQLGYANISEAIGAIGPRKFDLGFSGTLKNEDL